VVAKLAGSSGREQFETDMRTVARTVQPKRFKERFKFVILSDIWTGVIANLESDMRKNHLYALLVAFIGTIGLSGCYEVEDTIANVIVLNELGAPVQGATVRLYAFGSVDQDFVGEPRFDTTAVSNAAGMVTFNFSDYYVAGQAGFAVLDIEASKAALYGTGLIKIEEQTLSEATVFIE